MGGAKGWRWRAGLCHGRESEVGGRRSGAGREILSDACTPRMSDPGNCPPVRVAIVSLLRRGRMSPPRRCMRIHSVTRRTSKAVPDLADPDPLVAPAQNGAQGLQLGVIEEQIAAPRPCRRLDDSLA